MNEFIVGLREGIIATSALEWAAVLAGISYVILAAKKHILCWPFAFISSVIYVYLCYTAHLYLESTLQVFYVIMAFVGWFLWNRTRDEEHFVKTWPLKYHMINISVSIIVALSLAYLIEWKLPAQEHPYVDAFTTVFSLVATFMVTKKLLYNWVYWIVIDLVSIYLYSSRDFYLSAVLYFVFTILAAIGFMHWRKQLKLQTV